jgi:predicted ATPase/DNA-binding CsgD family transcriptional regulator
MGAGPPSTVFVGRDRELSFLADAFTAAGDWGGDNTAAVLLGGDAGVGKSRLVTEFTSGLDGRARVLTGGCLELGENGLPFAPFTAVLRGLVRDVGVDGVVQLLPGGAARELGRLLPALGQLDGQPDADLARARLFEEVIALLQGLVERQPVILVIEDIHWADRSSRDLLSFVVGNQPSVPGLLTLVTYRSDQLGRGHPLRPLLAELARFSWVRRLDLDPLSKSGVSAQLRGLLGGEPASELLDGIYRRSEGNPLFVQALLAAGAADEAPVPGSVRDLLAAPLQRLPGTARDVIRAAACSGVRVGHALLAEVTDLGDAGLSQALRPAVDWNLLLVAEDAYVFRHALIREVVYADLLPGERALLHVRYAEALEREALLASPGRVAVELAYHWRAAGRAHASKALTAAWRAAEAARESVAYAEQLQMLSQVLELWESVPDAVEQVGADHVAVLETAIQAAVSAGEGEAATALITRALTEIDTDTDPGRAGQVLRHRGELRYALGLPGDIDDLRAAARLVPPGHPARAAVLNTLANRLLTIPYEEEGRAAAQEAILAAQQAGDARSELTAAINLAYAGACAGDLDGELPRLAEARAAAERLGDTGALLHAYRCEADVLQAAGRHEPAAAAARSGLTVATQAGLARTAGPTHAGNLAEALISLGRWDEAVEILEHALELTPTPNLRAYLQVLRGAVALARGDLAVAEAAMEYAHEVFTRGTSYAQDHLLLIEAEVDLRVAQDRPAAATTLIERTLANQNAERSPRYLWPVLTAAARAVTASSARPDRGPAADRGVLLAHLRALSARLPVIGPVQRAQQLTFAAETASSPDSAGTTRQTAKPDGPAAWDRAAAAWADLAQPYPQAKTLLRAAAAAVDAGDRNAAAERLRRAAGHAELLAAHPLRAQIDQLARLARISLDDGTRGTAGPSAEPGEQIRRSLGLTPRELEVLRLLAQGSTNRQIAEKLFISVKTASVHVSNILTKLDVSSRVQAATAAHRLNLVDEDPV